jgi:hypothetical protein
MAARTLTFQVPVEKITPLLRKLPYALAQFTIPVGVSWRENGEVFVRVDDTGPMGPIEDERVAQAVNIIVNSNDE